MRKFSLKYPHLGCKCDASESVSKEKSWAETVNRGNLYVPSEEFYSQLKIMRNIFKEVNGEALREGENCVKTLTSNIQLAGVNLRSDVVSFYAKVSIFFMIRHLNKKITQAKQASSDSRSYARKKDENRDIKVTPYKDGLIKLYEEDYYYYFHYYCYYTYYNHGLLSPT